MAGYVMLVGYAINHDQCDQNVSFEFIRKSIASF